VLLYLDFFDIKVAEHGNSGCEMVSNALSEQLPEGFFDDPKMDAKVCRNKLIHSVLTLVFLQMHAL
jgi:hypothetical protein